MSRASRDYAGPYVGAAIRRRRKQRGWTIRTLAARVQMNANHLGDIENGNFLPSIRTLLDIAAALDVRASDILDEAESTFRPRKPQ